MKLAVFRKHVDDWKYHDSDLTIKKPYWLQPIRQFKKISTGKAYHIRD